MLSFVIVAVVSAAAGFGASRVKNAKKLAAVEAVVAKFEGSAVAEVAKLIADVRAKL